MADDATALATLDKVPAKVENVFLAARNSAEMAQSQKQLSDWLSDKLAFSRREYNELCASIRHAETNKWDTKGLKSARSRARNRWVYYEKLLKAVEAGYIIIPWMGFDCFAIRVVREQAKALLASSIYSGLSAPEQSADNAPAGEGQYVSPQSSVCSRWTGNEKDSEGKMRECHYVQASSKFRDVEFPVIAAKPTLMNATAQAMALKIFDEIGIVPRARSNDPMIVGRVHGPKGRIAFLIAWYLDTRAL